MVDNTVSSEWWKTIIHHFIKVGDNFEIRCWKEETEEILQVKRYGKAIADGNEISIKGAFVDELLLELMEENPADKEIYNKMTKYFTINVKTNYAIFGVVTTEPRCILRYILIKTSCFLTKQ